MIISIAGPDTYRSREKLHSIQNLGLQKQAKQEIFDFEDGARGCLPHRIHRSAASAAEADR